MMTRFTWALRRELWENRWLYLTPAAFAAVMAFPFARMAAIAARDPSRPRSALVEPYDMAVGAMMAVGLILAVVYCVDALYSERRDRSVLFWKSLPVSDLEIVLAKLFIPIIVLPLIIWALTVAMQLVMLLASSVVLAASGAAAARAWSELRLMHSAMGLLYHLVVLHGLALAPAYAWMLLVSAWAPRAPLAFALLPPVAIGVLERVVFGTTWLAEMVFGRLSGDPASSAAKAGMGLMDTLMVPTLPRLFVAPGWWIGFAVAALFVLGAVRLRRSAQPA